ncbi:polysaccharide biosynthesis protein [Blastococcus sp. TF02A-30]|nr:polysaccharide biosynthesis protein [Blastococcus sp. TF02A-30]
MRPLLRGLQLPAWSAVQMAVQMGVALLSARWLGPGDRGDLVLATTVATLMLLVSSLGAGQASHVVLAEPGRWWTWSRYLRLAALLTVPHVLLSATVALAVLLRLSTGDTALAVPFVVYSATALSAHLLREGLHGLGRHRTTMAIDVSAAALQLLAIAGLHATGQLTPGSALYAGAACYAGAITAQVLVGYAADPLARGRAPLAAGEWWSEARGYLRLSRVALVAAAGQSFVVIGDRLVLGAAGSPAEVGIYAAASSLAQISWVAPVALAPMLTRRVAEAGTLDPWRHLYLRVMALTAVLAVAVAGAGWVAIPFLLGDTFTPARDVLPVLCAAALPYASYHVDSAACAGLRDLRAGAVGALAGCLVLVATATGGYQLLGTAGIAWGVLVTYVVMAAIVRWRTLRLRDRTAGALQGRDLP